MRPILCKRAHFLQLNLEKMLLWLVALFVGLCGYLVWSAVQRSSYWRNKNVPGPTQWPLVGTFFTIATKGVGEFDLQCTKRFGRFFAYYDGPTPIFMTSDLIAIRSILVKDFDHFVNRREFDINGELLDNGVSILKDQRWKDVRSVLVPTFTSGKMRQMNPLISECCATLVANLGKLADSRTEFEAKKLFGSVTMDVIASTFFGTKVDSQNDPNNEFVKHAYRAFGQQSFANPIIPIAILFPQIIPILKKLGFRIQFIPQDVIEFFVANTESIINMRKENGVVRRDFLQLMLNSMEGVNTAHHKLKPEPVDTNEDNTADVLNDSVDIDHQSPQTHAAGNYKLSSKEVAAQAIMFFLAGYETTATALAFFMYALATNAEVQERLRQEIEETLGDEKEPSYDRVASMEYLDMCLNEVMRLYPPVSRSDRLCNTAWTYNGTTIEPGTVVGIPIFALQRDAEYWEDPETFNPERFSKANKDKIRPYSFETFGQGPRKCVGMRFAYFEMKMIVSSLLRNFRVLPTQKTEIPLVLRDVGFITAKNGVWVSVERLSS